jgi:hypothetical protein
MTDVVPHGMAALAAQHLLCRLSDNPRQFTEPPLAAFREATRARARSEQLDVMTCQF